MLFCIIHPEIVTSTPQKYISGETRDNGLQESFVRSKIHYDPTKLRRFEKNEKIERIFFSKHIFSGRKFLQRKSLIKSFFREKSKFSKFSKNQFFRSKIDFIKDFLYKNPSRKIFFWNFFGKKCSKIFRRPRKRTRIEKSYLQFCIYIIKLVRVQWWGRSPTLSGRKEIDKSGAPDMTEQPGFPWHPMKIIVFQWKSLINHCISKKSTFFTPKFCLLLAQQSF